MTALDDVAALREATREAHEALKDLRLATRVARDVIAEVKAVAGEQVDERIREALAKGLEELSTSVKAACDESTDRVFARFDTITATLLGEDKRTRRQGKPSIAEMIDARQQ